MPMFGGPHRLLGRLGGMKSAVVSPRMDDTARRAILRRISVDESRTYCDHEVWEQSYFWCSVKDCRWKGKATCIL